MKKLAIVAAVAMLGACSNLPVKLQTPQQLLTDFCPVVNADLTVLSESPLLTPLQQKLLTGTIIPQNKAVCAAGESINLSDLQTFNATAFPALVTLVNAIPGLPNQEAIVIGLTLAQPILDQIVSALPIPSSAPASTPVVAP